jgi:hypothetical protein
MKNSNPKTIKKNSKTIVPSAYSNKKGSEVDTIKNMECNREEFIPSLPAN